HQDEGGDDGLDPEASDEESVEGAAERGDNEREDQDGEERGVVAGHQDTGDGPGDGDHRTHGDVDPAGCDHERHAGGDDHDRRGILHDVYEAVEQVAVLQLQVEEPRGEEKVEEQDADQRDQGPGEGHRGEPPEARLHRGSASTLSVCCAMVRMMTCSSIWSALSFPTMALSRRTAIRSAQRRTSSSSEEMKRTAIPFSLRERMSFWISALAPTSIPRVGSSRMSRLGCVASQRATMAFCWFPPERFLMAWAAVGVRMSRSLMYRSAISSWRARGMFLNQPCLTCSARTMFSRRERSS